MRIFIALFILLQWALWSVDTRAQVKLAVTDVKEITVGTWTAGLLGHESSQLRIIPEDSTWNSYLISKSQASSNTNAKSYDSTLNRLIARLDPTLVDHFLQQLAVIKPRLTPETVGLTPRVLIADLQRGAGYTPPDQSNVNGVITQSIINNTIANTVTNPIVLDFVEGCRMLIYTRSNDTIKINSRVWCLTKLPWTVNNQQTYDVAINNFVVAAMGKEDFTLKYTLSINSLIERIYHTIDHENSQAPITAFKWANEYPENTGRLRQYFSIVPYWTNGDKFDLQLTTPHMPANSAIHARIDIAQNREVDRLISYGQQITGYLRKGNFLINYFAKQPDARIVFDYRDDRPPPLSFQHVSFLLPGINPEAYAQAITVSTSLPNDQSRWLLFPDGRVILFSHPQNDTPGSPFYPKINPGSPKKRLPDYIGYDRNGKIVTPSPLKGGVFD